MFILSFMLNLVGLWDRSLQIEAYMTVLLLLLLLTLVMNVLSV